MPRRTDVPVARVVLGPGPGMAVSIYGFTADEMLVALVEISGAIEDLHHLTVEQADALADGLKLAVRGARGEVLPTALDTFLQKART
jgi:predicted P-loop ATPase/GTPase